MDEQPDTPLIFIEQSTPETSLFMDFSDGETGENNPPPTVTPDIDPQQDDRADGPKHQR